MKNKEFTNGNDQINSANLKNNKAISKKTTLYHILKIIEFIISSLMIVGLLIGIVGTGYILAILKTTPKLDVEQILNLNLPSNVVDRNGQYIDMLPTKEERYIVKHEQIPENLINAFISIEDERFMEHKGIDIKRIVGSAIRDILIIAGSGEKGIHGGSTMTQQLVKNTVLYDETYSATTALDDINRKIKEICLSVQLEEDLSKDEVMTAYLNTIPLGGYIYGVEAASLYFFNKSVSELSLIECAYIAGITQMPTYYSAFNTEADGYPESYKDRTKTVLMKMMELGYISDSEYKLAYTEVDKNNFTFVQREPDYKINYEWYVYPAIAQIRSDLKNQLKYSDAKIDSLFMGGGLTIYLAMDKDKQDIVQSVLDDRANLEVDNGIETLTDQGVYMLQAAATVIDYRTGDVIALVGGRGEQPPSSLNRAYDDLKPIASTTKPLTVYGPAIDTKVYTAATPIDDSPVPTSITSKYSSDWSPANYDNSLDGYITSREAIAYSKNVTSIKTVDKLSLDTCIEYGRKAGIIYNSVSERSISALALGQHDNSPEDRDGANTTILASAYGSFGNNGVRITPSLYTKVVDSKGNVIIEREPELTVLFSPQTAYIMYDILKGPVSRFDASGAKFNDMPVSGKTGTTDKVDHFWFAGLTPYYSCSVWIGYDISTPMSGWSSSAANLFGKVMAPLHEGLECKEIEKPSGLTTKYICMDSGKLATELCSADQRGSRTRNELFASGTEPTGYCDVHVKVKVNKDNNKLATANTPANKVEEKVYIVKPNASASAADYPYIVPTENDDTKPEITIRLSQIGLKVNMDLYDALNILKSKDIKFSVNGVQNNDVVSANKYKVVSFTSEIKEGETVEVTVSKNSTSSSEETPPPQNNPPTQNTPPAQETPPTQDENTSGNTSDSDNSENNTGNVTSP